MPASVTERRAVSPVVSTVIITATLLIVLVVATALASSMLEIQFQNLEFEQAKTVMMALDKVITEVSLRPGAASSVQFNQRSGGVGVYRGEDVKIYVNGSVEVLSFPTYVLKYRGGSMVSAAPTNLSGSGKLVVEAHEPLGHVRVEVGNGAWIVLDYNRARVVVNEELGVVDVFVIRLQPGTFGGSGTVTIRVQNKYVSTTTCRGDSIGIAVDAVPPFERKLNGVLNIRITEVAIEVSTM